LLETFALVGGVVVVLAVLVGIALARMIAAPLRRITAAAAAAAAGDLSVRAGPVSGRDEVSVLARGFDLMLGRLDRAFERQRQFVSDASHELRTPLAVARAQVELLDQEVDEARRHEATVMLLRRLDELNRLVGDMLTLASAEDGRSIQPQPIDLAGFFEDVRRDLPLFGDRAFRVQAVSGSLIADPERLTQVIRNLVRNAIAHTRPDDTVAVIATANGDRLEIAVTDTGVGIPPEALERVFERFHRLPQSRGRDRGGTGLGLPIARAIIEAHGGWIRAESTPGHGSTFRFELPGYSPSPGGTPSVATGAGVKVLHSE
jgi:signal transduction histidine kinase